MSDPQRLLEAHVAFMDMAKQWTERGIELVKEGRVEEVRAAKRRAEEWMSIATRLEELTKTAPPG